jgi:DNA-binding response OmpR family regulator
MATVMIVDDEKMIRTLISKSLNKKGHLVFDAADGDTALQMIREITPDVVIMDLMMPDMDGIALAKEMRSSSFLPTETQILLMSGFHADCNQPQSSYCDINAYMNKPFNMAELIGKVSKLASRGEELVSA